MIRTEGKVYEDVKQLLQEKGMVTGTLEIVSFGRGTYHDIILNGEHIGNYEHRSSTLFLLENDK